MANEIRIIFSALDQVTPIVRGITAPLRAMGKDITGLTTKLIEGKINFGAWTSGVNTATQGLIGMKAATAAALAGAALLAVEVGKIAVGIQPYIEQTRKYNQIMRSYGLEATDYFNRLRVSSGLAFDAQTLMTRASDMAIAGGREMLDLYPRLINYVMVYSQATGREAKWALDRLVLGMLRGSARILDDIGLVMNARQVYKDWAEEIGKATNELTGLEKRQAIWAETETLIEDKLKALGEYTWGGAAAIRGLKAGWTDLIKEGKRFVGLALEGVIINLAGALQAVFEILTKLLRKFNDFLEGMAKVDKAIRQVGLTAMPIAGMLSPEWAKAYAQFQLDQARAGWAIPQAQKSIREEWAAGREARGLAVVETHPVYNWHIMANPQITIRETADIKELMRELDKKIAAAEHDVMQRMAFEIMRREIVR